MKTRRLVVPATLALTVLGLGAASCNGSSVTDAGTDEGPNANCNSACMTMNSSPNTDCTAVTETDGAIACVASTDGGGSGSCSFAPVVNAPSGACCCLPVV